MPEWLEIALRVVAGVACLLVFYLACFVYEDEEKRIQSKLEDWWLQIGEAGSSALEKQGAFLRLIAGKLSALHERLFGSRMPSLQAFFTSAYFSVLGISLAQFPTVFTVSITFPLIASIISPRLALLPSAVGASLLAIGALSLIALVALNDWWAWFAAAQFLGALLAAPVILALAAALRGALRRIQGASEAREILRFTGVIFGASVLVVLAPAAWLLLTPRRFELEGEVSFLVAVAFLSLLFAAGMLPLGFSAIGGLMLVHRVFWPAMARALYPVQRQRMIENKKLLNFVALVLAGLAFSPAAAWSWLTKKLLPFLG